MFTEMFKRFSPFSQKTANKNETSAPGTAAKSHRPRGRRLCMEPLESRELLAVNVFDVNFDVNRDQVAIYADYASGASVSAAAVESNIGQNNYAVDILIGGGKRAIVGGLSAGNKAYLESLESQFVAGTANFLTTVTTLQTYDAEKKPGDYWGCGLGTAANMLAQSGWGNVNGFTSEDDIFNYFRDAFTYETGSEGGFSTQSVRV